MDIKTISSELARQTAFIDGPILQMLKSGNQLMDDLPRTLEELNKLREDIKKSTSANNGQINEEDKKLLGKITTQEKAIGAKK